MEYMEHQPASWLEPFLDCYWILRADTLPTKACTRRVLPDICADIILNLGEDVQVANGQSYWLRNEKAYFVGSMTTFQDTFLQTGTHLLGIRFKPFALTALFGLSLQGTANCIEELDRKLFSLQNIYVPAPFSTVGNTPFIEKLNYILADKIKGQDNSQANDMIETVLKLNGQITVEGLANKYHMSERQLERKFQSKVGITLKEVCNLTRFHYALHLIRNRGERSLLDIAFEAGYYDHAHLTRHIKRYAGYLPSQIS